MALTAFQCEVLRLLAAQRRERGESYVAGGTALNQLLAAPRVSRDIDFFHDTQEAVTAAWESDGSLLRAKGYGVEMVRALPSFFEARVTRGPERTLMEWSRDSAFRFFPLVEDPLLGLTLHPFDLATNKVLAMAGRREPRDWIDLMTCDEKLQPLGYLVWAACGKDPGFNPRSLLAEASRAHYSQAELDLLAFDGPRPDAAPLSARWHEMLDAAREVSGMLPPAEVGKCVVTADHTLFRGEAHEARVALERGELSFHDGRIGGSWPSTR